MRDRTYGPSVDDEEQERDTRVFDRERDTYPWRGGYERERRPRGPAEPARYERERRAEHGQPMTDYGRPREGGMTRWGQRSAFGLGPRGFRRSDERVYEDVCIRLTEDPLLDASDVDVEVRDGDVILRGDVESREAKRRAEDIAEDVIGISDVRNELRVRRGGSQGLDRDRGAHGEGRTFGTTTGRRTVAGVFDDIATAQRAIEELRAIGIGRDRISLVTRDTRVTKEGIPAGRGKDAGDVAAPVGAGAVLGGIAGGALGWLLGIGAIAIPGLGPVVAAGAIATALGGAAVGAAAGGIVGALASLGIPEREARDYERRIREGAVLVTASGLDDDVAHRAKEVLDRQGAHDVRSFEATEARRVERRPGNGEPAAKQGEAPLAPR